MDVTLNAISEYLSIFADYIEKTIPYSRERDDDISRIQETVFWITYLNDSGD